ncbi:ABC-type Fe3+ transport system [Boeremia exigua]|uniref:ABC-type Fe3+ transport system n=1 Tax=Boeremia exigua TaxID=749465 RepID=UPI001E8D545B|nr:ABC-type Fe3+ transport system [Boeremia exigua]KAH6638728.1 ABC-type Fe3+ transport system [Boeremia exigua]
MRSTLLTLALLTGPTLTRAQGQTSNGTYEQETRSLDEIYQAALAEGGVVTLWHGGDEKNQQDFLKQAFEARFPNITLNVTVDLSKYHDTNLDVQLAAKNVYVDSVILQTVHDFPRWKAEGALLNYAPKDFDKVYPVFKDQDAAYTGLFVLGWSIQSNTNKTETVPTSYNDLTRPEFKDKLVLTYPNDDDAVLWQFDLLLKDPAFGLEWFDALLANNPRWVRGTATPQTLLNAANSSSVATFTAGHFFQPLSGYSKVLPTEGTFVTWAQTGAILKDAPHPEGAKLLHNFLLSDEQQAGRGWSIRSDLSVVEEGIEPILEQPNTRAAEWATWMADRENVERLKFFFEQRIGTAQGLSPLEDDL